MIDLIKTIADWQNQTSQQLTDALNAASVEYVDSQLYTWAGVALIAGPTGAEGLRIALDQNGMGWAVHQLGGSGLQLSNELVHQALLGFAQAGVPGCAELAATGKRLISKMENAGLPPATVDQVEAALFGESKRVKEDAAIDRLQAYREALAAWDGIGEEPVL